MTDSGYHLGREPVIRQANVFYLCGVRMGTAAELGLPSGAVEVLP
jgi:hypothetical protein